MRGKYYTATAARTIQIFRILLERPHRRTEREVPDGRLQAKSRNFTFITAIRLHWVVCCKEEDMRRGGNEIL